MWMYGGVMYTSASGPQRPEGNGYEPSNMVLETKIQSFGKAVHDLITEPSVQLL